MTEKAEIMYTENTANKENGESSLSPFPINMQALHMHITASDMNGCCAKTENISSSLLIPLCSVSTEPVVELIT